MSDEDVAHARLNTGGTYGLLDTRGHVAGATTAGTYREFFLPDNRHVCGGGARIIRLGLSSPVYGSPYRRRMVFVFPNHGMEIT